MWARHTDGHVGWADNTGIGGGSAGDEPGGYSDGIYTIENGVSVNVAGKLRKMHERQRPGSNTTGIGGLQRFKNMYRNPYRAYQPDWSRTLTVLWEEVENRGHRHFT